MADLYRAFIKTKDLKHLFIGLLSGFLLFTTFLYGTYYNLKRENETTQWVLHSQEEIYQIERAVSLAKEFETVARGALLTDKGKNSGSVTLPIKEQEAALAQLGKLFSSDAVQKVYLDSLAFYLHKKAAFSAALLQTQEQQSQEAAMRLFHTNAGKKYMTSIRQWANTMNTRATQTLEARKKESEQATLFTNQILAANFFFLGLLLLYMLYKGWQQEKAKNAAIEKLRQREEHYRTLIENNGEAIVLWDQGGVISFWSPAAERILGWSRAEALTPGFSISFHPEDQEEALRTLQQVTETPAHKAKSVQRARHKNGHYVWIEGEAINLLHQESVQALVFHFRDVSARRQADLKVQNAHLLLEKSVNNLKQIMDSSLDIICTIDTQGRFVQVSEACATIWGYGPEELTGRAFMDLVTEEDKELTTRVATSIMAGNPVTMFENRYVRSDGSIVPLLWSAQWDDQDQLMYCVAKDATEKKELEKAFHLEKQRFNDLFMLAPSCNCVLKGPDHRYISTNALFDQLVGSGRQLLGQPVAEMFPEMVPQGFIDILDQVYATGQPFVGTEKLLQIDHTNGEALLTDVYMNMVIQAYQNQLGEVEGLFFYGINVTEQVLNRKKLEQRELNFRQLIQDLPAAIYTCSTAGQIELYNKAAVELWGREPRLDVDRWCGSHKMYDLDGNLLSPHTGPMAVTLATGVPVVDQEVILERPNGERRFVKPHPVLSYDSAGKLHGGINILFDITESKNASDQIRRNEAALAEAQHIAKIGSWNLDAQTQALEVSEELYHIFETDRDGFTGTLASFIAFVTEEDREYAQQVTLKAFSDGEPYLADFRILTGKKSRRTIQIRGNSQKDVNGQVLRLYGTAQDITERKEFETALLASEEKYKLLFYQAPLPKWIYDLETLQIMDVNDSAIAHYGFTREEFLAMTAKDLRPAKDVPAMIKSVRAENTGKGVNRLGLWNHIKKDGTPIIVEISAHSLVYENRSCLLVEANDVTTKVLAEQALKNSNDRWEMLSKVTFDAIWEWNLKTNELFCGENYKVIFGQHSENARENFQAWQDYLHPEDRERIQTSLQRFLASGDTTWQAEYRKLKRNGEYAYCTDRCILIRDEQGAPDRMVGALRDETESKQAAESLLIEKTFSEALLEASPDGIVGFNQEGEILLFNKKAETLFGYSQEEILGASLTTLMSIESHEVHLDRRTELFNSTSQAPSRELQALRKDGYEFPVDVSLSLLHSYKGKIVICSIRDITERKLAEKQLRESEKNLQAILSSSREAIYLLDVNLRVVLLNEHAKVLIQDGFDVTCTPGDHFPSLFESGLAEKLEGIYAQVLAGQNLEDERQVPLRQGMAYYYSVYFPVRDNAGNIIGLCCSSRNITERKKIEKAVKAANAEKAEYQSRFKAILDYSPQAVLIKDLEGKFIFSNKAFLNLFDLDRNHEIGLQLKEIFDDQEAREEFQATGFETDPEKITAKEWAQQIDLPDGKSLNMEVIKFPLYDNQKNLFGICTICKDITEQMRHQQQLIEARENAEQAERLQEQFLANMSHELRTPMNGIIGMVNLLLTSSSLQADQKDRLQVIQQSSDTLLTLINDILDLSKIKAGMLTIENVTFDFNESIAGTALLFREKAKEKGIRLTVATDPYIPRLLSGDPHRLNQILNNLLSNAIKFTSKGFVRLEASLLNETEEQVVVEFVVSDSGIGMDSTDLLYIFDNFAQASHEISSKYGGTGLGLAITKRLIEMQGGEIQVESTKGKGTTFTFHLPYTVTLDTTAVVQPFHQTEPAPLKRDYTGKRALIVEDNDINQAVLASNLKQHRMEYLIAPNGQEAVDLLEAGEQFDIIFMDLRMPVMNGFQATAYIRQKLQLQVPIVVLTASVLRNERNRCLEIGASEYMAKPFAMADLARALEQFVPLPEQAVAPCPGTTQPEEPAAAPALPAEAGFDISRLLELEDGPYVQHILEVFASKMPTYLQELKSLYPAGSWEDFLEKTHKIKGSLAFIQITEVNKLIVAMEEQVEARKSLTGLGESLEKCVTAYHQTIPAVQAEVTRKLASPKLKA
ncbi:PAS domain S-box protein [Rufibacter glacialis]|uniref:Sensory/regulatory protein RpfC n=1 Tax=Rufibacter glacialis TaxID=1259555 RepID=A0A5M8QLF7_9BACT|nr:PAS domain S-box protein [Rufibacter glacialis]KAA6435810.1 PAS domain S-box protein [Rufibacter glacialis]GGK66780.1 hypothetical protein GCM10011405_13420 [Rufibacter glacialis]